MKIAISAVEARSDAPIDPRFGRCAFFIIFDTDTGNWNALPNPANQSLGGAGTRAAQFITNQDVEVVISGRFGPKAQSALEAVGIELFKAHQAQVDTLVEAYQAGQLIPVS
ncbi:MAG: NifB/NifX family molybdenum-iron cluster-binding protein [Anaerolineales bacterium]|jgi:predicted Fe-Mo cluster-binding NifX family protein